MGFDEFRFNIWTLFDQNLCRFLWSLLNYGYLARLQFNFHIFSNFINTLTAFDPPEQAIYCNHWCFRRLEEFTIVNVTPLAKINICLDPMKVVLSSIIPLFIHRDTYYLAIHHKSLTHLYQSFQLFVKSIL